MEDARIRETDEPITGEDLWYMDDVESYTYECLFCGVECRPCSYDKDVNLRRPHFRKLAEHYDPDCLYKNDDLAKTRKQKQKAIRTEDGKPGHYPSEFSLPLNGTSSKPKVSSQKPRNEGVAGTTDEHPKDRDKGNNRNPTRDRPYKTSSFRLLVNHFINFPNDRDLPLTAESIDGFNYRTCFKSLFTSEKVPLVKPKRKIYYNVVRWSKPILEDEQITIEFDAYVLDEQKQKNRLYLEVDTKDWSARVKKAFLHDFEKARKEVIDANGDKKLLVFFIGEQDEQQPLKFTATNPRLLSLNVVEPA